MYIYLLVYFLPKIIYQKRACTIQFAWIMKLKLKLESEPEPEPGQSDGSSEIPRLRLRKPAAGNVFHCAPLVLQFNAILFFINNILYDARVICQKYKSKFYCYFTFYFSIKLSILLFKVLGIGIFFFLSVHNTTHMYCVQCTVLYF